jgi:hypothetical protein
VLGLVGTLAAVAAASFSTAAPAVEPPAPPAPEHAVLIYEWAAQGAECTIDWTLIGGVAGVASNHGQLADFGESTGQRLEDSGTSSPAIVGELLDGANGRAHIGDTDQGRLDSESDLDRAVGPFQFIPETWAEYGRDGNGDGVADPQSLWDASAAAADFLCANGADVDVDAALTRYFGTDQWNDWAKRRQDELIDYQSERATYLVAQGTPAPSSVTEEVVQLSAPPPAELVPAATPHAEAGRDIEPVASPSWLSPSHLLIEGDWNGDGHPSAGALEFTESGGRFVFADHLGRPYGSAVTVDVLLPAADLQQITLHAFAGDWNGDGVDSPAVVIMHAGQGTEVGFDERGAIVRSVDLGPLDPLTVDFAVAPVTVPASLTSGAVPEPWKTETVQGGTQVELLRTGGITVAESLAQPLSDLLTAAATDGIHLEGWGWRSHQAQIELRRHNCPDVWTAQPPSCSPPTAIPGTSQHEIGLAIDFHVGGQTLKAGSPEFLWLAEHAVQYGLINLPSEPWHWSTSGD